MSALAIIPYRDDDFESVTRLWSEASRDMGVPIPLSLEDLRERWRRELRTGWRVHIARDEGALAGFVVLKPQSVEQLFVAADRRNRGIGKSLLDFAKAELPRGFHLTTPLVGRAGRFYEREGLVRGETSRHRFGHEIVRYDWRPYPSTSSG